MRGTFAKVPRPLQNLLNADFAEKFTVLSAENAENSAKSALNGKKRKKTARLPTGCFFVSERVFFSVFGDVRSVFFVRSEIDVFVVFVAADLVVVRFDNVDRDV